MEHWRRGAIASGEMSLILGRRVDLWATRAELHRIYQLGELPCYEPLRPSWDSTLASGR